MRRIDYIIGKQDLMTLSASDLMEDTVVTCSPRSAAVSVAMRLCDGRFGSLPVVDEERTLQGLVSEFDVLNVIKGRKDLRKVTAEDIMTRAVVTAPEDMPVAQLIDRMQTQHLIRLPVLRGGKLVGIVARRDILYAYLLASFRHEGSSPSPQ